MRLHVENDAIRAQIMDGTTALEMESHRIDPDGHLAKSPHPFADNPYIDRDFSEDQIEINTPPFLTTEELIDFLDGQLKDAQKRLAAQGEMLWPFSNPPVIRGEGDIPVAVYTGEQRPYYDYRLYLADRYGKYKMTYSGIHFNYSFSNEILQANHALDLESGAVSGQDFTEYKNNFYLSLAEKVLAYSWAVVALLAASPLVDNSFFEKGKSGRSLFTGFASLRCSELGYWNLFLPILKYRSVSEYAQSIQYYIDRGLLQQERELYYPVRVKPAGRYSLQTLCDRGINHIELRQVDLNPLARDGIFPEDIKFLNMLMVWLASIETEPLSEDDQMQALANHKNAAAYDWDLALIHKRGEGSAPLRVHLKRLLGEMEEFYADDADALEIIRYQKGKTEDENVRYASRVRSEFGEDYIALGLRRARELQEAFNV